MNQGRPNILIVDDERFNILALAQILQSLGDILIAKNGESAIMVAKENQPDLILLDVIMPKMTGFEVLVELKNSDLTHDIPVIFITGLNSVEDEEKGFRLGAVDYITKPFNNTIVIARVKTHLQIIKQMRTIEQLSMSDVLTNLPNRRSFDNRMGEEWNKAIQAKDGISILMVDVDKFKDYNDTYGHPQGDVLLQTITDVFKKTLKRRDDFVARWGGEEFMVLLPHTDGKGAFEVAERLRKNIEDATIPSIDGENTSTTISIGVNTIIPSRDDSISDFILGVDKALYSAKEMGRNRVCVYNEDDGSIRKE